MINLEKGELYKFNFNNNSAIGVLLELKIVKNNTIVCGNKCIKFNEFSKPFLVLNNKTKLRTSQLYSIGLACPILFENNIFYLLDDEIRYTYYTKARIVKLT